jgi:hypothetical protein
VNKESLSDKKALWQIEELLLILFVSGRFHTLDDILLLSEIFEKLFPDSWLIGFKGNRTFLVRQLEIGQKNGHLIHTGSNFGISSDGRAFVLEIIGGKLSSNENLLKILHLYRKMLWNMPRVHNQWRTYLEDFLRRLNI